MSVITPLPPSVEESLQGAREVQVSLESKAAQAVASAGASRIGKPVTLADGRTAVITRRAKGKDLIVARRLVGKDGYDEELAFALLSQVLTIGGLPITYEEAIDLDLVDLTILSDDADASFPEGTSKS